MKVAAYQAPLLTSGSMEAIDLIAAQVRVCERKGVQLLCCPEAILGGLADNAGSPREIAIRVDNGQLKETLKPLSSDTVSTIVGFTEVTPEGILYNSAAVLQKGALVGIYRKAHPAINSSVYSPGDAFPTFAIGSLNFGVIICNDSNFKEPARAIAAQGASVLFIPTNNGLPPHKADVVERARIAHSARAVENKMTVVVADVAGQCGGLISYGVTAVYNSTGASIATSAPLKPALIIADVD